MNDFLFSWMNDDALLPKTEDVFLYEIPNRPRRCARTPLEFLKTGAYTVEIQDLRKSISQSGRPYFSIELIILESSNLEVKRWSLVQEMYMLDTSKGLKKSLNFLEALLEKPKDLTNEMLHFILSDQDEDNWNSPFAGTTMTVNVKEQIWDGGKKTNTKFQVWK